jgi:hypothetical protein
MSDYNWCHGPECHTQQTQSRVRGSKGNKVLRTIKIKQNSHYIRNSIFSYFCNNRCLHDFLRLHATAVANIAPRREALETKIKDPVKETTTNNYGHTWTNTRIEVDNA